MGIRTGRMYWFRFTVEGSSYFPADMLRREQCFPYSTDDAVLMFSRNPEERKVELACWQKSSFWEPNYERWKSFGWKITQVVRE